VKDGPLTGIRVLDFSRVLAGPHCARMLCDLGADVIKVEPPAGDLTRFFLPRVNSLALYHVQQNCGKRNVSLDFDRPEAVALVRAMVDKADVLVENFRPGVMAKMGLGYDELSERNPRLVYASISGYGQDGPWASRRAYARIVHAESGIMMSDVENWKRPPAHDQYSHADVYTALECVSGVLAALFQRERTGRGQHVDVAMAQTMLTVNEHVSSDLFGVNPDEGTGAASRGNDPIFRTSDGRYLTVSGDPAAPGTFEIYCDLIGRDDLLADPRFAHRKDRLANREALVAIIQEFVLTLDGTAAVEASFGRRRLAVGVLRTVEELADSDWSRQRAAVVDVSDRAGGTVRVPNAPWRFSDADTGVRGQPAYRGEHNAEVLGELLGMNADEVKQLEEAGVLSSRGPRST
jgi:CoA:oxalate CoA-transferase